MRALSSTTAGPRTAAAANARRGPPPARADKMCRDVVSTPKPKSDATGEAVVAFLGAAGAREDVTCAKVRGRKKNNRRRKGVGGRLRLVLLWLARPRAGQARCESQRNVGEGQKRGERGKRRIFGSALPAQPDPPFFPYPTPFHPHQNTYILDAGLDAGLELPYTCRAGICGACVARVVEGEVDQSDVS